MTNKFEFDFPGYVPENFNIDASSFNIKDDPRASLLSSQATRSPDEDLINGPKWKPAAGRDIFKSSAMESVAKKMEQIKSSLSEIQDTLDGVSSFVDTISQLEELIEDVVGTVAKELIKQLDGLINDLGSTGVYMLDMINYSATTKVLMPDGVLGGALDYKKDFFKINKKVGQDVINYKYMNGTLSSELGDSENLDDLLGEDRENLEFRIKNKPAYPIEELLSEEFWSWFRPITYSEFITTVAEAFVDPEDTPRGQILDGRQTLSTDPSGIAENAKKGALRINYNTPDALFPGAPTWRPGSTSVVYIIAFQSPDISEIFRSVKVMYALMKGGVESLFPKEKDDSFTDQSEAYGAIRQAVGAFKQILEDSYIKKYSQSNGGTYPDFYGLTLESIFPGIFGGLRGVSNLLRNLSKNTTTSLSDIFDGLISDVEASINFLKRITSSLENVVALIKSFNNLNASVLKITSNGGVYDIYDQLISASNFPGQEDDEPRWILGLVLAAGKPGPGEFNLSKYLKKRKVEFNEESNEIKESYKEDDGGTGGLNKMTSLFG